MYYQVTDYYDPVGQKEIPNKCPDCGNQNCLKLHFYQKRIETPFSKKVSKKVTGVLFCENTQTEISPVLWSDEIEHRFKTEKEKLQLHPTGLKFTKWFYGIFILLTVMIVVAIGYFQWEHNQYIDQSEGIKNAAVGDKVMVMQTLMKEEGAMEYGNTWYQITNIEGDTLYLKQHKDFNNEDGFNFELENTNFSGEIIKASLARFKERSVTGFDHTDRKFSGYITEIKKEE